VARDWAVLPRVVAGGLKLLTEDGPHYGVEEEAESSSGWSGMTWASWPVCDSAIVPENSAARPAGARGARCALRE
jgi:hypothetical protein